MKMRKIPVLLVMAAFLLPMTATAKPEKPSKEARAKESKKSSKSSKTVQAEPQKEPEVTVDFSDEQIMLNNQAVDAANAGNYKKAEQLYNAMLQIAEMNVIWANLGGTYLKEGKCLEAAEAYKNVWTSPKISQIPAEQIEAGATAKLKELERQCNAQVVLNCPPAEMTVTIDGGAERPCSPEPLALMPGRHAVFAQTSYGFTTVAVDAEPNQTTQVAIEVIDYEKVALEAGITPEEIHRKSVIFKSVGYSFLGVGVAIGVGGGALLATANDSYNSKKAEYDTGSGIYTKDEVDNAYDEAALKQNISYGMIALGSAMTITGIVLVVYDAVKIVPQLEEFEKRGVSLQFAPTVSPKFSGFMLSGTF